jgi:hypothetical protein
MKHQLMHPGYPDLVRQWIEEECANDNAASPAAEDKEFAEFADELGDRLIAVLGAMEIAATRLW